MGEVRFKGHVEEGREDEDGVMGQGQSPLESI